MSKPTALRRSPVSLAMCVAALGLCTVADLASKDWAMERLSRPPGVAAGPVCEATEDGVVYFQRVQRPPITLIDGYLELRYAENCGAAFGVLHRGPAWLRLALFAPAALAATLGLLWLYWTGYGGRLFEISVPLIASGAIGNLMDRFRLGYVVDFIRFHVYESFVWPTFNVADATITIGVALLLIEGFASRPSPEQPGIARPAVTPQGNADTPR